MTPVTIEAVGLSDAGNVRQFNEDRIVLAPEIGVVALADGMGGHRAGEVASQLAAQIVVDRLRAALGRLGAAESQHPPLLALSESINQANLSVFEAARADPSHTGMGTTLAVAVFHARGAAIGHVGDSRIYRLRGAKLTLLTRDDSLLRQQLETGLIAAVDVADSHNRSLVTQALGIADAVDAHALDVDTIPGDVFLLCTDGLNDLVDDADLELIVSALKANLPLAAQVLVQTAKDNGGYDNVSVILVKVAARAAVGRPAGWLARAADWFRRR